MKKIAKLSQNTRWIKKVQDCLDTLNTIIQPQHKIMVAVSGGADSIMTACLLYHFFIQKKYDIKNLRFIHCNHNTRTGNRDDEKFITSFFKGTQVIISKRTSNKKNSETELRKRRYEVFQHYTKKHHIDQLIFGHNLTDRIESTFLNLLRGANINGFLAMKQQELHHLLPWIQVVRPLLWLTKDEITQICTQQDIPFITDPTNYDTTTSLRNKLRNEILPTIYKLAHKKTTTNNSFVESIKNIYEQIEKNQITKKYILKPIVQSPHRNTDFAYQRKTSPKSITSEKILEIMKMLNISNNITTPLLKERTQFLQKNTSGYKYFNKTYFFKSHGNIYIISWPIFFWKKTIDKSYTIHTIQNINREGENITIQKEYLNATLRFPTTGDIYKKKTRNEYCINQKIPIFRRNFIPIVVKKNQIIKIYKK